MLILLIGAGVLCVALAQWYQIKYDKAISELLDLHWEYMMTLNKRENVHSEQIKLMCDAVKMINERGVNKC
jgi:hypothetical protein